MRKIKAMLIFTLFAGLFALLCGCARNSLYKVQDAYVTIDINPSVEIITGEDGLVAQVNALNDDAELLLLDTDFTGLPVDQVTEAILVLATEMGYLDSNEDNAIIITAEAGGEKLTAKLEQTLTEKVQEFVKQRQMRLEVIQARFAASEDMKQEAENLGISIGKLKLITYAMTFDGELTVEAGAKMSVKELIRIIRNGRDEIREFYNAEIKGRFFSEKQNLQIALYKAIVALYNQALQNADPEVFAEILGEGTTVDAVKALAQEYCDAIAAFEKAPDANQDEAEAQIAALEEQYKTLNATLKEMFRNFLSKSKAERVMIKRQISQAQEQLKLLNGQIRTLYSELPANLRGGMGFRFEHKNLVLLYINKNRDLLALKNITKTYRNEFAEINVEMESLKALFTAELQDSIDELKAAYEADLEAVKQELRTQVGPLKEQLKKEKEALREIWKKGENK